MSAASDPIYKVVYASGVGWRKSPLFSDVLQGVSGPAHGISVQGKVIKSRARHDGRNKSQLPFLDVTTKKGTHYFLPIHLLDGTPILELVDIMAHLRKDLEKTKQKVDFLYSFDSAAPSAANSSGPNGPHLAEFWEHMLHQHNEIRRKHGLSDLIWDASLVPDATAQATDCEVQQRHFHGHQNGAGQNCFTSKPPVLEIFGGQLDKAAEFVVENWYKEIHDFDFKTSATREGVKAVTGHFTQLVWKDTQRVGGGISPNGNFVVCNYFPPGNISSRRAQQVNAPI